MTVVYTWSISPGSGGTYGGHLLWQAVAALAPSAGMQRPRQAVSPCAQRPWHWRNWPSRLAGRQRSMHCICWLACLSSEQAWEFWARVRNSAYSLIYSTEKNTKRTRHKNYSELTVRLLNEIERKMLKWKTNYYFFCLDFSVQYHTNKSYLVGLGNSGTRK